MTLSEYLAEHAASRQLLDALRHEIARLGPATERITKSQVAFSRRKAFAWAWAPDQYLGDGHAPLVLSLCFAERDPSPRWKEIVEPSPGRLMHHLELFAVSDLDDEVAGWLQRAWDAAA